ncbi:hypothetical protein QFZ73_005105 [Peribacillus sp. V2I11]|nr:hypothetical protein [Peribacillus sp. V2I11]
MEAMETAKNEGRKLKGLVVPFGKAYEWGNSRKGYWHIVLF